jgi:hypothetical protein
MKKNVWWKTESFVFAYAFLCLIAIVIQGVSCYVSSIPNLETIIGKFWYEAINHSTDMEINAWSILWTAISCAYVGIDRSRCCIESFKTTDGSADYGDPARLRKVILISGILLVVAMACQSLKDGSTMDFAVTGWVTAFGGDVAFYVAGMQTIKLTNSLNVNKDLNGDGKIDEEDQKIADAEQAKADGVPFADVTERSESEKVMDNISDALKTPESTQAKNVIKNIIKEDIDALKNENK